MQPQAPVPNNIPEPVAVPPPEVNDPMLTPTPPPPEPLPPDYSQEPAIKPEEPKPKA